MADLPDMHRQPVLILGASGYIGSRLAQALSASHHFRPIRLSRKATGPDSIAADVSNPAAMRTAITDAAYVVNCIAGDAATMRRTTQVLLDAARLTPPRRIVHLSSMAVYGAATGLIAEDHPPVPPISGYGEAKRDCERMLQRYVEGGGDAVILRPSCVFGPGSPQWTIRIATLLRARRLGDLGPAGDGVCNLALISDLTATITSALDTPGIAGRAFNVSNPETPTWNEFLVRFGLALGATPIRRIPSRTLTLETKLLAPIFRIAGKATHAVTMEAITPSLAALFAQDIRINSQAAASILHMPATPVERMIEAAALSLRTPTAKAAAGA